MKYCIYCLFSLLVLTNAAKAQIFEGRIIDISDTPIEAVTIYVPQLRQGILSDDNGDFLLPIQEGKDYTLVIKHPDYADYAFELNTSANVPLYKEFILKKDSLYTDNISESERKKYANSIIRNCINQASSCLNAVEWYKGGIYVNGKMVLNQVSDLVDEAGYRLDKFHVSKLKEKVIIHEAYDKLEFFAPDTYLIENEARIGHIPNFFANKYGRDIVEGSIYSSTICGFISPLDPAAFRYYSFDYMGYQRSKYGKIYKIQIKPKLNNPKLANGYLYIYDNLWIVSTIVFDTGSTGTSATTTVTYCNIETDIYLPVTYSSKVKFNIINTISGDLDYDLALNYDSLSNTKKSDSFKDDIKYLLQTETSLAANSKKGEDYWSQKRLQPKITDPEIYVIDSLDVLQSRIKPSNFWLTKIIAGDYLIGSRHSKFSFKYDGVKMVFRDYNYVDGLWLGNQFDIKLKLKKGKSLTAKPYIYYTTAREQLMGGSDFSYNYNLMRKGQFSVNIGSITQDFNRLSVTRYQNYFSSLFMGKNYNFFYQLDYGTLNNQVHISPQAKLSTTLGIEKRTGLKNNTRFNVIDRNDIKPNIYAGDRFDRAFYAIDLSYSPHSEYSITDAVEMYQNDISPIFNIEYEEAFSSMQVNNSKYRKLRGGFSHNVKIDEFNKIDYRVEAGVFLSRGHGMHFTDYQHFGASDMLVNLNSLFDSFLLLDNYQLYTNKYWYNTFFNYSGKYVLLKFIPALQDKPFSESLHLKTLFTPEYDSYIETGYSISFNRYVAFGGFVSFHNIQGRRFGVRLSINLRALQPF